MQEARATIVLPAMDELIERLRTLAHNFADVPMLGRTHGQTATPTTVGKELANFAFRLQRQRSQYANVAVMGKINGAVGNFNAHVTAYPKIDWCVGLPLCAVVVRSERYLACLQDTRLSALHRARSRPRV